MPTEVQVAGADQLERLGARLKDLGDKELRRELFSGITRATKPLKLAAKQSARAKLPKRGGLNELVASQAKLSTRTRVTGKTVGVRLVAALGKTNLRLMDRGELRHPVYGNRAAWVVQEVEPGWFSDPMHAGEPLVRREVLSALDDLERKL